MEMQRGLFFSSPFFQICLSVLNIQICILNPICFLGYFNIIEVAKSCPIMIKTKIISLRGWHKSPEKLFHFWRCPCQVVAEYCSPNGWSLTRIYSHPNHCLIMHCLFIDTEKGIASVALEVFRQDNLPDPMPCVFILALVASRPVKKSHSPSSSPSYNKQPERRSYVTSAWGFMRSPCRCFLALYI